MNKHCYRYKSTALLILQLLQVDFNIKILMNLSIKSYKRHIICLKLTIANVSSIPRADNIEKFVLRVLFILHSGTCE